jgi:hypothetical protein
MSEVNRGPAMQASQPTYAEAPKASKMPWVILGLVVVILLVVGVLFREKLFGSSMKEGGKAAMTQSSANKSEYQAVFLTNGQVYFGKVSDLDKEFMTVKDIYYLQVIQQPPLQGSTQQPGQQAPAAAQPQISLVKLGNELHGPIDEMHISKSQILFYEDLKKDGSVVKAISDYKANPSGSSTVPAK